MQTFYSGWEESICCLLPMEQGVKTYMYMQNIIGLHDSVCVSANIENICVVFQLFIEVENLFYQHQWDKMCFSLQTQNNI